MKPGRFFPVLIMAAAAVPACLAGAMLVSQASYAGFGAALRSLTQPWAGRAVLLSLVTATVSSLAALAVAVPAAYGLARRRFPGAAVLDVLIDVPIVLSPVAVGVSLLLLFRTRPGSWVEAHLVRFVFEIPGIMLAQFTVATALAVRVLTAAFRSVNPRYEQVARFLGCNQAMAFHRVSAPLARRGIVAAFVLAWARALGEFGATSTLAGAVPGRTETLPVAISNRLAAADVSGAIGLMIVLSVLGLALLVVLRLFGDRR